jgi:hypothetical protein
MADRTVVNAACEAIGRAVGGRPGDQDAERLARLTGIDPREPLDEREAEALWAGRAALLREAGAWRRMAATAHDEAWRSACRVRAEDAEHFADEIGELRPGAAIGATVGRSDPNPEGEVMSDEGDVVSRDDPTYEMYEALTDPRDEAELLDQEAEGQPVMHVWAARSQELAQLRAELGLGDLVVEQEPER